MYCSKVPSTLPWTEVIHTLVQVPLQLIEVRLFKPKAEINNMLEISICYTLPSVWDIEVLFRLIVCTGIALAYGSRRGRYSERG